MARDVSDLTSVSSRDELVQWLEVGSKDASQFRIGAEHEKIPFYISDHSPVPYIGVKNADTPAQGGVRALLEGMQARTGWEPIWDGEALIGLADEKNGGAISLEPGGQFELSGAPLGDIHAILAEFDRHMADVHAVARPLGVGFLDLGMSPLWPRDATPVMPKHRYAIMARYMPRVGAMGLDMMFRTATVQANLDFSSEADMVDKVRVTLALQPVATALFANSPFADGKVNGFLSMRSEIWRHTDAARTGMMPFAFEPGFGFEHYVDYALDVPMYFVKRGDVYHDVAGARFADLLHGRLPQLPGEQATLSDWANHLSTIFPEVRLKRYIEMRGADVGPRSHVPALAALFAGLLYDSAALDSALQLIKPWTAEQRQKLRDETPRLGLQAEIDGRPLRTVALDVLAIARKGLTKRAKQNALGQDETIYLAPLEAIADSGRSLATQRLERFHGPWRESVMPAFEECAF